MKVPQRLWDAVEMYGFSVGLGTIGQLFLSFLQITFMGFDHVAVFEPNVIIRTFEFFLLLTGLPAFIVTIVRVVGQAPNGKRRRMPLPTSYLLGYTLQLYKTVLHNGVVYQLVDVDTTYKSASGEVWKSGVRKKS